jgi:hypothetical protein
MIAGVKLRAPYIHIESHQTFIDKMCNKIEAGNGLYSTLEGISRPEAGVLKKLSLAGLAKLSQLRSTIGRCTLYISD